jgi:hypothetical protein
VTEIKRVLATFNSLRYTMAKFINEVLLFLDRNSPTSIVTIIDHIMVNPKLKD